MAHNTVDADQINLGKHLKVRALGVHLDVHCGVNYVGAWLDNGKGGQNSLGIFMRQGEQPYLMCWPEADYGNQLPFAFGPMGLQVPHPGGTVTTLSLKEISDLVQSLGKERPGFKVDPIPSEPPPYVAGQVLGRGVDSLVSALVALPSEQRNLELAILKRDLSADLYATIERQLRALGA